MQTKQSIARLSPKQTVKRKSTRTRPLPSIRSSRTNLRYGMRVQCARSMESKTGEDMRLRNGGSANRNFHLCYEAYLHP